MLQENVLLVGGTEKSRALLQALIPPGSCAMSRMCQSGGEARRVMQETAWSLILINTPLSDESGLELAMEAAEQTMAAVLLLVKAELADTVADRVEASGVMVIAKPVSRQVFEQAQRFALAARNRLTALHAENERLEKKMAELRLIDRAKCVLIQYRRHDGAASPSPHRKASHGHPSNQSHRRPKHTSYLRDVRFCEGGGFSSEKPPPSRSLPKRFTVGEILGERPLL